MKTLSELNENQRIFISRLVDFIDFELCQLKLPDTEIREALDVFHQLCKDKQKEQDNENTR